MARSDALARDLALWGKQLAAADRTATWRDVVAFQGARAQALHLMVDVRRDVTAVVGGRTLDAGKGRRKRGYRAGVWAAPHAGSSGDWWVGGTGKLHWLDQGTDAHDIPKRRKTKRRRKEHSANPDVLLMPSGPVMGPVRHPGAHGNGIWGRSTNAHSDQALAHGTDVLQKLMGTAVPLLGD